MMKNIVFFVLPISITLIIGCTTTSNIHGFRGKGRMVELEGGFVDVYESAKTAATLMGLHIKEESTSPPYLILGHKFSLFSYGELVAVYFVESPESNLIKVEVISKPKVRTNVFAPKWEDEYIATLKNLMT